MLGNFTCLPPCGAYVDAFVKLLTIWLQNALAKSVPNKNSKMISVSIKHGTCNVQNLGQLYIPNSYNPAQQSSAWLMWLKEKAWFANHRAAPFTHDSLVVNECDPGGLLRVALCRAVQLWTQTGNKAGTEGGKRYFSSERLGWVLSDALWFSNRCKVREQALFSWHNLFLQVREFCFVFCFFLGGRRGDFNGRSPGLWPCAFCVVLWGMNSGQWSPKCQVPEAISVLRLEQELGQCMPLTE